MAGTIGAVNNLAELIVSPDIDIRNKASELIKTNSEKLANQLIYYRYAYGYSPKLETFSVTDIKRLTDQSMIFHGSHIKFNLISSAPLHMDVPSSKLLMCLVISAYNNIVKDGKISVNLDKVKQRYSIKILVEGVNLRLDDKKLQILLGKAANSDEDLDIYNSHEYYIYYLIKQEHYSLTINRSDNCIEYDLSSK